MKNHFPAVQIRCITVAILLLFCIICAVFIPRFLDYAEANNYIGSENRLLFAAAAVLLVLPCAAVLVMALKLSSSKEDRIFTEDTAQLLWRISMILAIDCGAFAAVTVILFCLRDTLIAPLFALIDLVGLALSYLFYHLSVYIARAAEMKEEVDATL